jgi:hypothetical protein
MQFPFTTNVYGNSYRDREPEYLNREGKAMLGAIGQRRHRPQGRIDRCAAGLQDSLPAGQVRSG